MKILFYSGATVLVWSLLAACASSPEMTAAQKERDWYYREMLADAPPTYDLEIDSEIRALEGSSRAAEVTPDEEEIEDELLR